MKKIYVHVGMHKTGTTSIQWFLSQNRSRLRECGYLYPESGCPEWAAFGQHMLPWIFASKEGYVPTFNGKRFDSEPGLTEAVLSGLLAEIESSGCDNIILSSEEFDILDTDEIQSFGEFLSGYKIIPIVFVRNFIDYLDSAYRTTVVYSGYWKEIDHFVENQRTRLALDEMIKDWQGIAFEGEVHVLNYDDKRISGDVISSFNEVLDNGLPIDLESASVRKNHSYPASLVEVIRFMRSKGVDEARLAKFRRSADIKLMPRMSKMENKRWMLGLETRKKLDARYREVFSRVAQLDCGLHGFSGFSLPECGSKENNKPVSNVVEAILSLVDSLEDA